MKKCKFEKVKLLLDDALDNHHVPSSDIVISLNGETIFRYMNGTVDEQQKAEIKGDELYYLYSTTKVITCTAALQLYEKGLIGLQDEVGKYIPEFKNILVKTDNGAAPVQTPVRLIHLFTMTSGMNYDIAAGEIKEQIRNNPESGTLELVRAMARVPLGFEPGTHYEYSLSHDVLAAVIEIVSGMSFSEYLQKNIFDVCGMKNTYVGCDNALKDRMCCQYLYHPESDKAELVGKDNMYILTDKYESGGAGVVSCVEDYLRFANELVNGEKLLKRSTIDLMRTSHLAPVAREEFKSFKRGYSYGLGVRTNVDGAFSTKGEFGWDGAAGAYVLLDPDNKLAVFYATHIKAHGYLYDELHPALRDAIYEEIERLGDRVV